MLMSGGQFHEINRQLKRGNQCAALRRDCQSPSCVLVERARHDVGLYKCD